MGERVTVGVFNEKCAKVKVVCGCAHSVGRKISDEKYFNVTFSQHIKITHELHDRKELIECDGESLLNFF